MGEEGIVLKLIQISDLHIKAHKNLLAPMVDSINNEPVDLVVVTGDTVNSNDNEVYKLASNTLNKIKHKVVVLPGDYDNGKLFNDYFGNPRLKSISVGGYNIDFLDTSFMKHRFAVGWADVMEAEDPEQHEWLIKHLESNDNYHIVFSHHPMWVNQSEPNEKYTKDNLRAVYSGHMHTSSRFYFKYQKPKSTFPSGFASVPIKFHGNSCYLVILFKSNHEIANVPRAIDVKRTAW
jgi:predicted MPP superfamily phosphohydrolase